MLGAARLACQWKPMKLNFLSHCYAATLHFTNLVQQMRQPQQTTETAAN
jgi:hypothetical protein